MVTASVTLCTNRMPVQLPVKELSLNFQIGSFSNLHDACKACGGHLIRAVVCARVEKWTGVKM